MSSTSKTENLGLSQWTGTDAVEMADFNADFQKIDDGISRVKLFDITVSENTEMIQLDLTDIELPSVVELQIYLDWSFGTNRYMRINGVSQEAYLFQPYGSSSNEDKIRLPGNLSKLVVTHDVMICKPNASLFHNKMTRSDFPEINSLEFFGDDNTPFVPGDRIVIWRVKI